jgi:hypothetical protein
VIASHKDSAALSRLHDSHRKDRLAMSWSGFVIARNLDVSKRNRPTLSVKNAPNFFTRDGSPIMHVGGLGAILGLLSLKGQHFLAPSAHPRHSTWERRQFIAPERDPISGNSTHSKTNGHKSHQCEPRGCRPINSSRLPRTRNILGASLGSAH